MNLTVTNAPSVADLARGVLEGRSLVAGEPFYAAGNGIVVVVAPLPRNEVVEGGFDHEFTVSTGFPPDPGTGGITVWEKRHGEIGEHLERLGETDRFGALLFTPGPAGTNYQLTLSRSPGTRLSPEVAAILQFTAPTAIAAEKVPDPVPAPCAVCRAVPLGWNTRLGALREAWGCGTPVCHSHLTGQKNLVLAAARHAWQEKTPEVFQTCSRLLADLLDEHGAVRKGFLQAYPPESHNQALNQAAGILSTAVAVGQVLTKNAARAAAAGHAAVVRFQAAMGTERHRNELIATKLTAVAGHPLGSMWSQVAKQTGGGYTQGFLAFRSLCASITQQEAEQPLFLPLRDQPITVQSLVYDRDHATGQVVRIEFFQAIEGCSDVYLDPATLGFHVLDSQFLRSLESAWRAVQPSVSREQPRAALCVRVTFGDDIASPVVQGGSMGLAVACGMLAVTHGDVLDESIAVTGELLSVNGTQELGNALAGWTTRVTEKLTAAQQHGIGRVVVGVVEESGQLDREPKSDFEVTPVRTVQDAYRVLDRGRFGKRPQSIGLY